MTEKILIIVHQEHSTPGRIGQVLERRGFQLDIRRPRFGDPLPTCMSEHFGAVIFGGPMSVNDKEAFIRREIDWIEVPLKHDRPFLGVCLGAQMMAKHLGSPVYKHKHGFVEIGYYPIRPTPCGTDICDWPGHVYQWHNEGNDLPRGAKLLAEGDHFECQAFQYGNAAFGVQFHAEVTLAMLHKWTVRGAPRLTMKGAQQRADHFAGRAIHDPPVKAWLESFIDHWVEVGRAQSRKDGA